MSLPFFQAKLPPVTLISIFGFSLGICLVALVGANDVSIGERIIKISAERYEFSPAKIVLKKGEPVILELTSEDRLHGFRVLPLGIRADVMPGEAVRVRVVPDKTGTFPFTCDLFCGAGHDDMGGVILVTD